MTDTLANLIATPIAGNYAADAALAKRINHFVESDASVADRADAVRFLSRVIYGPDDGTLVSFDDATLLVAFLDKGE